MSQKLSLVKFEIEDEIPIDETSQTIISAYMPDEFVDFLAEMNLSKEIEIKESVGVTPDIPMVVIDDIEEALHEVGVKSAECVKAAYEQVCGELLIEKEVNDSYRDLLIWLKIREIFKIKQEKYIENSQFRLVVG